MLDPVLATDGHTYERASIEQWIKGHGAVSMMTGEPLLSALLIPNQADTFPSVAPPPGRAFFCPPNISIFAAK
jgi:hypothetical protein